MSDSQSKMPPNQEEALFALALEKPAEKRGAFLDAVCEGDPALRQRLDALLAAHDAPDESPPAPAAKATIKLDMSAALDEAVGHTLGRYKLMERLGEGGCGVVYVAEQTQPVRRRVALKVIKLGMDTRAVVARFEAERQALAMMDHPNIAKVLDAGTTELGRPYFVMELVRGIRITDYCDQNQLSTNERLELFIKICQAIQHAHQKGIIHRDIKPSNILVTLHDGVPVPKVIDFGIAKATEGRLTDATVYTQLHQFIGTPAYMSPEQAEMSGLDIDTRSDIYSLGVLLYELLAGSTPFDGQELMSLGIDAMRKTIREQEPVRPSTRFATLKGEELTTTAKRRSTDKSKLMHQLRGDLDWIVMKCLDKDRTRRYETANDLAMDLKRHLNNDPVEARPPSTMYRFQKAFRRNKAVFIAGSVVALALASALVAAILAYLQVHSALRARLEAEQRSATERVRFAILSGDTDRTSQALQEAKDAGLPPAKLDFLRALFLVTSGRPGDALPLLESVRKLEPTNVAALGLLLVARPDWPEFERLIPELESAVPRTPDEFLFLGEARNLQEPGSGIALMLDAVAKEDSPMSRLELAKARTAAAEETGDIALVQAALADLDAVRAWSSHSLPTTVAACEANRVAAGLCVRTGDSRRAQAFANAANEQSERLESFFPNAYASLARLQDLELTSGPREALEWLRKNSNDVPESVIGEWSAKLLLLQGDAPGALASYGQSSMTNSLLNQLLYYLAAIDRPELRFQADTILREFTQDKPAELETLYCAVSADLIAGRTNQAREIAGDFSTRMHGHLEQLRAHYGRLVRYLAGDLGEEELLMASQRSSSALVESHFFVGLEYLAQGDRVSARKHFQAARDTQDFNYECYELSGLMLQRLETNPDWPPRHN